MNRFAALLLLGTSTLPFAARTGEAATRTVCFELTFMEGRGTADSPTDTETGNKRGRHADNTSTPAFGHLYELWDKDDDGDDEYIGTFIRAVDGRGCATFEWENADFSIHKGESNPDVYVKYINEVRHSGLLGNKVRALDETASTYPLVSWRSCDSAAPDACVAVECLSSASCDILTPGASLAITLSNTNDRSDRILALDTAQRALETFNSEFDYASDDVIDMIIPCVNGVTPGSTCPGMASTVDRDTIIINGTSGATNGRSPAHELGHLLHFVELGRDSLSFDYSLGGPTWSRTQPEFESAAVMEGWADFVAVASWWDDSNTGSLPRVSGLQVESGTPVDTSACSNNSGLALQVTKGFWDVIDANNEAAVAPATWPDDYNTSAQMISDGWSRFGNGSANRQDEEPSASDPNGRNLRDYYANNSTIFGVGFFTTLLNHNCTGSQDDN